MVITLLFKVVLILRINQAFTLAHGHQMFLIGLPQTLLQI
jgi:hypothetical protein